MNRRPLGYEPNELPTAPSRNIFLFQMKCLCERGCKYNTFFLNCNRSPGNCIKKGRLKWPSFRRILILTLGIQGVKFKLFHSPYSPKASLIISTKSSFSQVNNSSVLITLPLYGDSKVFVTVSGCRPMCP